MNTKPLERFATQARRDLLAAVDAQASAVLAPGSVARTERGEAVKKLEAEITAHGRAHVIDKVAYTWFNRIIALRFMDACSYTDAGVVSPARGQAHGQPEILADAKRGNLNTDVVINKNTAEAIIGLLDGTRRSSDAEGEAYALLLTEYCRYWHKSMPFMFEPEGDYTELLVPTGLLADGAILSRAREVLTDEVCQDVEVIGWLYQFYISERKAEVFAGFKKSKKAGATEIPAATQLFTPHWIVRYLVENSLGRLWLLNRPTSRLADQMDCYIPPASEEMNYLRVASPEELKVIDPACGSGHMLTYAFDLLYAIYEEEGYAPSDIPGLILTHNLFGTEIDPRAGALAAFALTMKARARQRTFFNRKVEPSICVLEPVVFTPAEMDKLVTHKGNRAVEEKFWNQFQEAENFGSLIRPNQDLIEPLRHHLDADLAQATDLIAGDVHERALQVLRQAAYLTSRYHVVVANPPYMGLKNMSASLSVWLKAEYKAGSADLFAAFIERCVDIAVPSGMVAMVTLQSWMFLKSFEGLRENLLKNHAISSFVHLRDSANHADVFGANSAFVLTLNGSRATRVPFVRVDRLGAEAKRTTFQKAISDSSSELISFVSTEELCEIPRAPIAYWMSQRDRDAFLLASPIANVCESGNGLTSSDNDRFLRYWWEVGSQTIEPKRRRSDQASSRRWHPINKGGAFRRWAGNQEYVLDWGDDGRSLKSLRPRSTVRNEELYFRESVSWSDVTSGAISFRYYPEGFIFDASANSLFPRGDDVLGLLALGNYSFVDRMAPLLNPGLHFKLGDMGVLPYLKRSDPGWQDEIRELVSLAQADSDSVETARLFTLPALLCEEFSGKTTVLAELVKNAMEAERSLTYRVHELETKNNREITQQHGMDERYTEPGSISRVALTRNPWWSRSAPLSDSEVTAKQTARLVQDFVSFAVGCMFGRYSLDVPGLMLADQGLTLQQFLMRVPAPSFVPDKDNVIPILDGDWFEDDIVARFRRFLRAAFGDQQLEENLRFITEALGVRDLRDYFVKSFYEEHLRRYKKRPIYWLFSSPKGSFNALIYMHRYTPSTVSTVLNEYLREYRAKLEVALTNAERAAAAGSTKDQKEADRLRKVIAELRDYEHDVLYPLATQQLTIDLNDGVKANYPKFYPALKKIVGLEAAE